MERFSDPVLFQELSTSELLEGSLITTLMGLGTTFFVLGLLWIIIVLISRAIKRTEKKKAELAAAPAPAVVSVPEPKAAEPAAKAAADTAAELVAVITAAIAAMEGTASANRLIIRKINRISGSSTAWGRAGSSEVIDSRKF